MRRGLRWRSCSRQHPRIIRIALSTRASWGEAFHDLVHVVRDICTNGIALVPAANNPFDNFEPLGNEIPTSLVPKKRRIFCSLDGPKPTLLSSLHSFTTFLLSSSAPCCARPGMASPSKPCIRHMDTNMGHLFIISRPQQKPNFATFASFSRARSRKRIGKHRMRILYTISCSFVLQWNAEVLW